MILIRGGRVVDPERKQEQTADLVIAEGKIAAVGKYEDDGSYEQVIDAAGCVVAPG